MRVQQGAPPIALLLALGAGAALLVCASATAPQHSVAFAAEAEETFSWDEESTDTWRTAQATVQQLVGRGLVFKGASVEGYLADIGRRLLGEQAALDRVEWRFAVLRDPTPNALAFPTGDIFVTSGLLATLNSEAELAGVLAHELVHVQQRHTFQAVKAGRGKALLSSLAGAGLRMAGGLFGSGWGSALSVAGVALPVLAEVSRRGYSQDLERAADSYAVDIAINAGFGPHGLSEALRNLRVPGSNEDELFYTDHPSLDERLQYITALIDARAVPAPSDAHMQLGRTRFHREVEPAVRDAVVVAIASHRFRYAVRHAEGLVTRNGADPANHTLLGDAFRALGPRAVDRVSREEKDDRTPQEVTRRILDRESPEAWLSNFERARLAYESGLELTPSFPNAWAGLASLRDAVREHDEVVGGANPSVEERVVRLTRALEESLQNRGEEQSHVETH